MKQTSNLKQLKKKNNHMKPLWKKNPFPLLQNWQLASIAVYNSEML